MKSSILVEAFETAVHCGLTVSHVGLIPGRYPLAILYGTLALCHAGILAARLRRR